MEKTENQEILESLGEKRSEIMKNLESIGIPSDLQPLYDTFKQGIKIV
ncbi:hypothetical protein HME9304_01968 [Flagellimonas maritima]|uniref:Uncharacterized protein n=1 Tax=Flagellimonas maritima TaxID=1383885 RepID=A0A2Z4LTB1_9FLAO|nr:hypothetical protein [Allomuricauda aurantiaca]AWX44962.1 hypothetical protein HME9304_01968 [Allomuricauda aurantiaca]